MAPRIHDKETPTFNKETRTVGKMRRAVHKTPPALHKTPPACPNFGSAQDKEPPARHKLRRPQHGRTALGQKYLNKNRGMCSIHTMHAPGLRDTSLELLRQVTIWADQPAWEKFSDLYRPLIHAYALRSGLTPEEAQELTQDLLLELAERLRQGEYDPHCGSFRNWLFRLARWRITNQFKKRPPGHLSLDQPGVLEALEAAMTKEAADYETWNEDWRRAWLELALDRLRAQITPRHWPVLHALVWHGHPVKQVARTHGLTRAAVYLIKLRGVRRLKKEIACLKINPPKEGTGTIAPRPPAQTPRRKK